MISVRKLLSSDHESLSNYLTSLSPETKNRFGPHPFSLDHIITFYQNPKNQGYIVEDSHSLEMVAYAVVRLGFLDHDAERLRSYGLVLSQETDATFAPSVADFWQSKGIGQILLKKILAELKNLNIRRIILWGGVQASNEKAIHYYTKNGFTTLGTFEYNGQNMDMILHI